MSWIPAAAAVIGGLFGDNSAQNSQNKLLKYQQSLLSQYMPTLLSAYTGMAQNPASDPAYNLAMREMARVMGNQGSTMLDQDVMGLERRGMLDSSMLPSMTAYRQAQTQGALGRGSYDWLMNARQQGLSGLQGALQSGVNMSGQISGQYGQMAERSGDSLSSIMTAIANAAAAYQTGKKQTLSGAANTPSVVYQGQQTTPYGTEFSLEDMLRRR